MKKIDKGNLTNYKKANPDKNFSIDTICEVCNKNFNSSLTKNIKKEDFWLDVGSKITSRRLSIFRGSEEDITTFYKQVTTHDLVCPNCGFEKKIFYSFCEPQIIKEEIETYPYVPYML